MAILIEHLAYTCLLGAIIGTVLGIWVFGLEAILKKFNLEKKFVKFMTGYDVDTDEDEDYED